jgi:hypothetical protein
MYSPRSLWLFVVAAGFAALATPWPRANAQELRYGPTTALGDGVVRTYLVFDDKGTLSELGVAVSEAAMATLPDLAQRPPRERFLSLDLELPAGAPAPFKLVGFFWRPTGHPPVDIYGVPHLEFHFYTIDRATRNAILPGEGDTPGQTGAFMQGPFAERASKAPEPGFLPAAYAYSPGSAVPSRRAPTKFGVRSASPVEGGIRAPTRCGTQLMQRSTASH